MINRKTYTKVFLNQAGKGTDPANIALHMGKWWQTRRTKLTGGLRLTEEGYNFLVSELELREHEIPFPDDVELSPSVMLFLDQYLECPYYLTFKSLTVFSEREAFKLHMFADDIRKLGIITAMSAAKSKQ